MPIETFRVGPRVHFNVFEKSNASNMKLDQKLYPTVKPFFSKMQLSEESFAILSILCLLSPDRGGNMCLRDRQQLNRLQVSFCLL